MKGQMEILKTGIHGLDQILGGGLLKGRLYSINGGPGTGKTIIGNQLAFSNAKQGNCSLFMTLLSESHGKMLENISSLDFFDESLVGQHVFYLSGFAVLLEQGIDAFKKLIISSIREKKTNLMLIDGFKIVSYFVKDDLAYTRFIHDLNTLSATLPGPTHLNFTNSRPLTA